MEEKEENSQPCEQQEGDQPDALASTTEAASPESKPILEDQSILPERPELPPELLPVAARHGQPLLMHSLRTASLNVAIDALIGGTRTSKHLSGAVQILLEGLAQMNAEIVDHNGWKVEQMIECIEDVGRARALARPAGANDLKH